MVVSTIHLFSFFLLYDLLFLNTLPTLLEKIMFCEKNFMTIDLLHISAFDSKIIGFTAVISL